MRDTVILTAYNRPRYILENTFRALYANDLEDCEVIVVDDGSDALNANELEVLRGFYGFKLIRSNTIQAHPETFHFNGHNNPAYVNNVALSEARGKHVVFLSSDCIVPPNILQLARLEPDSLWVPQVIDMDSGRAWLHRGRIYPMCWFARAPIRASTPFDLNYLLGMGFEDNDWMARTALATGSLVLRLDCTVFHQSHPLVAYQDQNGAMPSEPARNTPLNINEDYTIGKWGGIPWSSGSGSDPLAFQPVSEPNILRFAVGRRKSPVARFI